MSRVFVLGNAGIDLVLRLPRLMRPGETGIATSAARAPGGKGLNQAVVAARAGAAVTFCAAVGEDAEANFVAASLAAEPLREARLLPRPVPTDMFMVMVDDAGENSIVSLGACADALGDAAAATFAAEVEDADWLLLQGNLTASTTRLALHAARGRVLLNPAPLRWDLPPLLPRCAVVVANRLEAEAATGCRDPVAAAERLRALGAATAVVTLGAAGCVWSEAGGGGRMAAEPVRAVDTSGAGDVFCGALVARLAAGVSLRAAIAPTQRAAALSVTRQGAFAGLPTAAELTELA